MFRSHALPLHFFIRSVCSLIIICSLSFAGFVVHADNSAAVAYLQEQELNPWIVMALTASGNEADVSFLKDVSADTAIELEAPILALTAAGKDPRSYTDTDLIAALRAYHNNEQLGDPSLLNDDVFGVLALRSAGVAADDALLAELERFIIENQNADGGFPYAVGGTSDTNTTAAAIQALIELGLTPSHPALSDALAYLRAAQNDDGGFPYDPHSPYGTDSDASSDAWVIATLHKAGEDIAGWQKNGSTPVDHLLSLQADSGYFEYQPDAGENAFTPVTTSYALIALSSASLPVGSIDAPAEEENDEAPSSSHDIVFTITGSAGTVCDGAVAVDTALEVVKAGAELCDYTYTIEDTAYGPYVSEIDGEEASGTDGWLYSVNDTEPTVGASEYMLEGGDSVHWYFSGVDDGPLPKASSSQSVSLQAEFHASDTTPDDRIAFSIEPGTLEFGDVYAGSEYREQLRISNSSDIAITLVSSITGGTLFRDLLLLNDTHWRDWSARLQGNTDADIEAVLAIPTDYTSAKTQSGELIFWARPAQ